jgi:hypothetical protein
VDTYIMSIKWMRIMWVVWVRMRVGRYIDATHTHTHMHHIADSCTLFQSTCQQCRARSALHIFFVYCTKLHMPSRAFTVWVDVNVRDECVDVRACA